MEDWGGQWTLSGWNTGDDAGDLAAGRLQAVLKTGMQETWGRCWRFSTWKIRNDTKELANRRLG